MNFISLLAILLQHPNRVIWEERKQAQILANECYTEMLRVDPKNESHLLKYVAASRYFFVSRVSRAHLMLLLTVQDRKLSQYEQAGKLFREAIVLNAEGTKIAWCQPLTEKLSNKELASCMRLLPCYFDDR